MKGDLHTCMLHFGRQIQGDFEYRTKLCRLLGIAEQTGQKWFGNGVLPTGERRLKLRTLISLLGYGIEEAEALDPAVKMFGELVAFGIVTLADASDLLDYKCRVENDFSTVLRALLGNCGVSDLRIKTMKEIIVKKSDESKKVKERWREVALRTPGDRARAMFEDLRWEKEGQPTQDKPHSDAADKPSAFDHTSVIHAASKLIRALIPLAELLASDEFTADERAQLRKQTETHDSNGVFDLANLTSVLNRLCGETARKQLNKEKGNG